MIRVSTDIAIPTIPKESTIPAKWFTSREAVIGYNKTLLPRSLRLLPEVYPWKPSNFMTAKLLALSRLLTFDLLERLATFLNYFVGEAGGYYFIVGVVLCLAEVRDDSLFVYISS